MRLQYSLAGGLAWLGFLTFGVVSEQIKTRLEERSERQGTQVAPDKCYAGITACQAMPPRRFDGMLSTCLLQEVQGAEEVSTSTGLR